MTPRMLILIEFNELCPSLLGRLMDQGTLPNFRRLYESSTVFTTDAGEDPPNLEPWVQWPTVHSGLPYSEHKVFHLGDGRKLGVKCLAEVLSDAGVPVGVFGSMNLNYGRLHGYMIPDPWNPAAKAYPESLQLFYSTVARQVQESSREGAGSKAEMARFGLFLLRNGMTPGTIRAILAQLLDERRDPGVKWRRAVLLDRIQYDVFRRLNRRHQVRFASFFCNSTAHFQHYYWRNMAPEEFDAPPETDHPSLREAIELGYRSMDRLIGRFLADYPDAVLVLATALSQQPWTDTAKCTYRPLGYEALLEFAGIPATAAAIQPVMAEEFRVEFPSAGEAERAEALLRGLTVNGRPLMKVQRDGRDVFTGCQINETSVLDGTVARHAGGAALPFRDLFYMIHTMRSGRHHPDGVLWVRDGAHRVADERVPLTDLAPTVLSYFGVSQPAYMGGRPLPIRSGAVLEPTDGSTSR